MKIVLEHLTKKFPARGKKGEEVTAVRDFTFEIPDGVLLGLLGPSGPTAPSSAFWGRPAAEKARP